jgi:diguanylate cyclase (GGDEF)-like protein
MYISIIACCFIYAIENRRITENLKAKNSALTADAQKDPLTGLLNRRGFMPIITKLCKEDKKFSVAICDIDDFKKVNDTYGHDAGDQVLKEITALVKSESHSAEICRWGGEEIVILFDGLGLEKATRELEHIRERVQDYVVSFCDKMIKVTITIGVEQNIGDYDKADDAITVADKRLYYGKHHGKNVVINKDFEDDAVETNQSA